MYIEPIKNDEETTNQLGKDLDPNINSQLSKNTDTVNNKIRSIFNITDNEPQVSSNYKTTIINYNTYVHFKPQNKDSLEEDNYFLNENFLNNILKTREQGELLKKQQDEIAKLKSDLLLKENEVKKYKLKENYKVNKLEIDKLSGYSMIQY